MRSRLEKEIEEKKLIPESQGGFRKGRGVMDNVYVLNYLVQREERKDKKERKVYALFVDLRAAFDNIRREKLWKIMEDKGVNRKMVRKVEKIYEETEATIRPKDGLTEVFKIKKGVKQGCALSTLLFNVYVADIDKELNRRNIGGLKLGNERI